MSRRLLRPSVSSIARSRVGEIAPKPLSASLIIEAERGAVAGRVEDQGVLVPVHQLGDAGERDGERAGEPRGSALGAGAVAAGEDDGAAGGAVAVLRTSAAARASRPKTGSLSSAIETTKASTVPAPLAGERGEGAIELAMLGELVGGRAVLLDLGAGIGAPAELGPGAGAGNEGEGPSLWRGA